LACGRENKAITRFFTYKLWLLPLACWLPRRDESEKGEVMDEDQRLKEAFMDMLGQACGEWQRKPDGKMDWDRGMIYDSQCLSAYEQALDLAVDFEWIRKDQVMR
jgi:hypothetical protein